MIEDQIGAIFFVALIAGAGVVLVSLKKPLAGLVVYGIAFALGLALIALTRLDVGGR